MGECGCSYCSRAISVVEDVNRRKILAMHTVARCVAVRTQKTVAEIAPVVEKVAYSSASLFSRFMVS